MQAKEGRFVISRETCRAIGLLDLTIGTGNTVQLFLPWNALDRLEKARVNAIESNDELITRLVNLYGLRGFTNVILGA